MDPADKLRVYKEMTGLMRPGESVLKTLRRLGGGKAGIAASSASRKWKEKRAVAAGNKSASTPDVNRVDLLLLTGHADRLLQASMKRFFVLHSTWVLYKWEQYGINLW